MGLIIWNGTPSTDFGIIVEKYPAINHGAKRGEAYQIPGRNGTFYTEDGTFDNYIQPYQISIREMNRGAAARCADIQAWLSKPGFLRLEDSFELEYFKLARFAGPLNIEQILGRWGKCTLEFECQPERWLKSGEETVDITVTGIIHNPTPYVAKPIVYITRSASTVIKLDNDSYMTIGGYLSNDTDIIIDCENGTITSGNGVDLYGSTTFSKTFQDFPVLEPGENVLTASNASLVEIVPRWYML